MLCVYKLSEGQLFSSQLQGYGFGPELELLPVVVCVHVQYIKPFLLYVVTDFWALFGLFGSDLY